MPAWSYEDANVVILNDTMTELVGKALSRVGRADAITDPSGALGPRKSGRTYCLSSGDQPTRYSKHLKRFVRKVW